MAGEEGAILMQMPCSIAKNDYIDGRLIGVRLAGEGFGSK